MASAVTRTSPGGQRSGPTGKTAGLEAEGLSRFASYDACVEKESLK